MYSRLIRLIIVLTSLAPLFLSFSFVAYRQSGVSTQSVFMFFMGVLLFLICFFFARYGAKRLEVFSEQIQAIKSADSEVLSYLLAYFLPFLIKTEPLPDYAISLYIGVVFSVVLYNSNHLFFSPVLGMLGYHLYEVALKNGITCVLLTRRTFRGIPNEVKVVRLSEYVLLEKE